MRKFITIMVEVETDEANEAELKSAMCSSLTGQSFAMSADEGPEIEFDIISVETPDGFRCDSDLARII